MKEFFLLQVRTTIPFSINLSVTICCCDWNPFLAERVPLGHFENFHQAIEYVRGLGYPYINLCAHCCPNELKPSFLDSIS